MGAGHAALGGWGLVAAIVVLGFGLAVVFTAIYDGPVALGRLRKRENRSCRGQRRNGPVGGRDTARPPGC